MILSYYHIKVFSLISVQQFILNFIHTLIQFESFQHFLNCLTKPPRLSASCLNTRLIMFRFVLVSDRLFVGVCCFCSSKKNNFLFTLYSDTQVAVLSQSEALLQEEEEAFRQKCKQCRPCVLPASRQGKKFNVYFWILRHVPQTF